MITDSIKIYELRRCSVVIMNLRANPAIYTQGLIFSTLCSYQHRVSDTMLMPIRSTGFAAWSVDSICPISVSEIRSESYGDDMAE